MTTTFETAQVGDKVWCLLYGWQTIESTDFNNTYPIETNKTVYTYDGKMSTDNYRTLFWDEVIITPPPKPAPKLEVDTKVLVWNTENDKKQRRYFSDFFRDNDITTFIEGKTSWTTDFIEFWKHWELAKDEQCQDS